jgi:hypothetical protein
LLFALLLLFKREFVWIGCSGGGAIKLEVDDVGFVDGPGVGVVDDCGMDIIVGACESGFRIDGVKPGDWLNIKILFCSDPLLYCEPIGGITGRLFFFKFVSSFKTFFNWLNKSLFFWFILKLEISNLF